MNVRIPIIDLTDEVELLWDEINSAVQEVLRSGHFVLGTEGKAFEKEVADYLGCKHAIALNSGTDALFIALRALGIGAGDEVIVPSFTFYATAEAVELVGAKPVFAEINPDTFNVEPADIESKITDRTRAIIPVHLYGHAAKMEPMITIAQQYGLGLIEDTAQAFGGEYCGKKLGTFGHFGCFSFYPTKNLGAYGDAGMLTTDNDELAELARKLRTHGSLIPYQNELTGYNSRLDELQACILRVKLPYINQWNEARREAAQHYNQMLKDVPGIVTPKVAGYAKHVYHQYTIRVEQGLRDELHRHLQQEGIGAMLYYPTPVHQLPVYQTTHQPTLAITEQMATEALSLPMWPRITLEIQQKVVHAIQGFMAKVV
ncbi:erythromycin biosynthesis sensory transduction protein eryC1 [Brevibacillus laterosporus]|uniref:DegT/DnrJ/EryC1/StrS family aminotransferase n=1 Tax=Brevibacillus laterosporus TaxID=1465 RepID=UPI000CE41674|nr:DegT/DnrJ/EryC1/StrS family aminotransferase [Brevibacillus laterosporus]PPA84288.1 erythromycin biosynthesis sensory transduction protein eryC1 [Brevibacillus laterosporus]